MTDVEKWLAEHGSSGPVTRYWRKTRPKYGDGASLVWTGPTWHECDRSGKLKCRCSKSGKNGVITAEVHALDRIPPVTCRRSSERIGVAPASGHFVQREADD